MWWAGVEGFEGTGTTDGGGVPEVEAGDGSL